jgi:HlyD family secretion protein
MRPGLILAMLLAVGLTACGPNPADEVETLQVDRRNLIISILAEGELRATVSTPILPPPGSTNPRTISWLAPNFSAIKKGDVIVRFDISNAEKGALETGIELNKIDIDVVGKQRQLERLLAELGNELDLVEIEKKMAEQLTTEDSLAYSRYKIIDAKRNKELSQDFYLQEKGPIIDPAYDVLKLQERELPGKG